MKLIKQNDSAGGLIFKQNTNGKAMKQNYGFSKGISPEGQSIYLECPWVPGLENEFSIHVWVKGALEFKNVAASLGACFVLRNAVDESALSMVISYSLPTLFLRKGANWNTSVGTFNFASIAITSADTISAVMRSSGSNIDAFANADQTNVFSAGLLTSSPFTNLYLVRGTFGGTYESATQLEINVYNRRINDEEISYAYNNRLGNDPLNVSELKARYIMNQAEILDYEGVPSVCIRDLSGNENHARFLGSAIPAGTLEEQRDYINNTFIN